MVPFSLEFRHIKTLIKFLVFIYQSVHGWNLRGSTMENGNTILIERKHNKPKIQRPHDGPKIHRRHDDPKIQKTHDGPKIHTTHDKTKRDSGGNECSGEKGGSNSDCNQSNLKSEKVSNHISAPPGTNPKETELKSGQQQPADSKAVITSSAVLVSSTVIAAETSSINVSALDKIAAFEQDLEDADKVKQMSPEQFMKITKRQIDERITKAVLQAEADKFLPNYQEPDPNIKGQNRYLMSITYDKLLELSEEQLYWLTSNLTLQRVIKKQWMIHVPLAFGGYGDFQMLEVIEVLKSSLRPKDANVWDHFWDQERPYSLVIKIIALFGYVHEVVAYNTFVQSNDSKNTFVEATSSRDPTFVQSSNGDKTHVQLPNREPMQLTASENTTVRSTNTADVNQVTFPVTPENPQVDDPAPPAQSSKDETMLERSNDTTLKTNLNISDVERVTSPVVDAAQSDGDVHLILPEADDSTPPPSENMNLEANKNTPISSLKDLKDRIWDTWSIYEPFKAYVNDEEGSGVWSSYRKLFDMFFYLPLFFAIFPFGIWFYNGFYVRKFEDYRYNIVSEHQPDYGKITEFLLWASPLPWTRPCINYSTAAVLDLWPNYCAKYVADCTIGPFTHKYMNGKDTRIYSSCMICLLMYFQLFWLLCFCKGCRCFWLDLCCKTAIGDCCMFLCGIPKICCMTCDRRGREERIKNIKKSCCFCILVAGERQ